ncbi:MAG: hypothetical protein IJ494_05635 [Bacteroides sp.]|nr:hypothetical protein [Bacteroides sp.]
MNWQELIVVILLLYCAFRMGKGIYTFYRKAKAADGNPCEHCTCDCEIKRLYDKKRQHCSTERKQTKKSCCG